MFTCHFLNKNQIKDLVPGGIPGCGGRYTVIYALLSYLTLMHWIVYSNTRSSTYEFVSMTQFEEYIDWFYVPCNG